MPIALKCRSCGHTGRAPDKAAGKRITCPKCGAALQVPASDSVAGVGPSRAERPEAELTQEEAPPIGSPGPPPLPPQAEDDSGQQKPSTFLANDWSRATVAEAHLDRPLLIVLTGFYSAIQAMSYLAALILAVG